jgi:DNA polymerase III subunit delta'
VLAEAGGAPLAAIAYAEPERTQRREVFLNHLSRPAQLDVCAVAEAYKPLLAESWGWLLRWVHDVLSQRLAGQRVFSRPASSRSPNWREQADLAGLLALERELAAGGTLVAPPVECHLVVRILADSLCRGGRRDASIKVMIIKEKK